MRAFLAMELGDRAVQTVHDVGKRLASIVGPWGWNVGWVAPEKMHLTLKFFGNLPPDRAGAIADALAPARAAYAPFEVLLRGVGTFPERGAPNVVWVGVVDASGTIAALVGEIEERLGAIGLPREARPFHAHVTLGRVKARGNVRFSDALPSLGDADCGAARLGAVTLFRSDIKTGTYHVLERIRLGGDLK
jgi:2'-5' RNA ligase